MTSTRKRLTVDDIHGCWAIVPTPAKPNGSDLDATDTVDHEETARIIEGMIEAGVDGILTLGTLGECGALSWEEKKAFISTAVSTARGRVPIFVGTTTLSTRETIRQTREAYELGADGTMVGPPMWNKPDVSMAVQFFKDLAEAVPEMAICVYANPFVFKFDFPPPFWAGVADIPQVVMAKTATHGTYLRDSTAARGQVRIMPMDAEYTPAARMQPETATAFWSSSASCGPAPAVALRDIVLEAKKTNDWSKAWQLTGKMTQAVLPIICYGDMVAFQENNVALEKLRFNVAGWMNAGPIRPPHQVVPDKIKEFARLGGEAWASLQKEYE
jgi:trans-o-hydroxybenzylidenepyruvate hydratase-aldolase